MIDPETDGRKCIQFMIDYFASHHRQQAMKLLRYAKIEVHGGGDQNEDDIMVLAVRTKDWQQLGPIAQFDVENFIKHMGECYGFKTSRIFTYSYATPVQHEPNVQEQGLNNCFFKTEKLLTHDDLRFRSPAEISIYDELKKRKLLFFPNAAAVLGGTGQKREPDFLICERGKWGVLEVMGATYHTNAIKDHDRARLFKQYGLLCIEFYPAQECQENPPGVVGDFLKILASH